MATIDIASDGGYVVGGSFRKVFATPRSALAKITSTGALMTAFNPAPNGDVFKVVVLGSNAFVAGDFTQIGGLNRAYLAKLSTAPPVTPPWRKRATA